VTSNGLSSTEEGDVMLPCEFCEEMIPMYKLLSHQGPSLVQNIFGSSC
jgi:hypothetical protein